MWQYKYSTADFKRSSGTLGITCGIIDEVTADFKVTSETLGITCDNINTMTADFKRTSETLVTCDSINKVL
jgi:hypothetical protein